MFPKYIKSIVLILCITLLLFEIVLGVFIRYNDLKVELPTYTFENTNSFWFDANEDFGTIHLPKDSYRQKKTCFDVVYKSNSHGFRDEERNKQDEEKRVLVIGDSFIEGIGVDANYRVSNLLETKTGIPHLNFGVAGNFGPTQYYMLYKTLASKFTHDALLIGLLPSNDFIDDDYEINQKFGSNRYRPFLKGKYPNYALVYHLDSIHKSSAKPRRQHFFKKFLKNFTYSYNMLLYVKARMQISVIPKEGLLSENEIPTYFNYSTAQMNRMKYALEQIKLIAGKKRVMVFSIPTFQEMEYYKLNGTNPLGKDLKFFCDSVNIDYLDLLPITSSLTTEEYKNHFLSCDGHWSKNGNAFAMQQINNYFEYYK
jgi:hypothetical protein